MNFRIISLLLLVSIILLDIIKVDCYNLNVIINREEMFSENIKQRESVNEYKERREKFLRNEENLSFGSDIELNDLEIRANEIIMNAKNKEYDIGFVNPHEFTPSRHIFEVLKRINSSDLFKLLKKMPKGAVLHAHDTALCSTDYVLSLTYKENLWQTYNDKLKQPLFLFSRNKPDQSINGSEWKLVSDIRNEMGQQKYDSYIRGFMTLYTDDPLTAFKDINEVWSRFMHIFSFVDPLITYYPNFKEYFKQSLKELQDDGVQYLEFRGTLPDLYNLDGNIISGANIVQIYKDVNDEFLQENIDFIGSKFIYAPPRIVHDGQIAEYMNIMKEIHQRFPTYSAGFDLVGQEDKGRPLIDLIEPLLELPSSIEFYFHAGETNWYGTSSDDNLIDAILLGTKRIGHGFALLKHPKILEVVMEKEIAIEINPVSNQVLKLVDDYRNHPGSALFAKNYPIVVSSDDPSFWEATPLTHDFYQAFLGIASKRHDLRFLKRLAINSIKYSSMNITEKTLAFDKWNQHWDKWILEVVTINDNSDNNIDK